MFSSLENGEGANPLPTGGINTTCGSEENYNNGNQQDIIMFYLPIRLGDLTKMCLLRKANDMS